MEEREAPDHLPERRVRVGLGTGVGETGAAVVVAGVGGASVGLGVGATVGRPHRCTQLPPSLYKQHSPWPHCVQIVPAAQ